MFFDSLSPNEHEVCSITMPCSSETSDQFYFCKECMHAVLWSVCFYQRNYNKIIMILTTTHILNFVVTDSRGRWSYNEKKYFCWTSHHTVVLGTSGGGRCVLQAFEVIAIFRIDASDYAKWMLLYKHCLCN